MSRRAAPLAFAVVAALGTAYALPEAREAALGFALGYVLGTVDGFTWGHERGAQGARRGRV